MPHDIKDALLIYNPTSGRKRHRRFTEIEQAARILKDAGIAAELAPTTPSVPSNYASLLLDNGCRAEFDLTHSKQRIGVTSTRQFRKAFHRRAQRSSNLSFLPLRAKKDPSLRSGITSKNTFSANSHAARY